MKRIFLQLLNLVAITAALGLTALAQQPAAARPQQPAPVRPRAAAQQPLRDATKAANAAAREANAAARQEQQQNLAADNKNARDQKKMENAVVDNYLGGFQKQVGLNDDQTRRFSGVLGNYIRMQMASAQDRTNAMKRLQELTDQQASQDEIQNQYNLVKTTETQLENREKRFYANMNPQLSIEQQARLKVFMERANQRLRQAIQKAK